MLKCCSLYDIDPLKNGNFFVGVGCIIHIILSAVVRSIGTPLRIPHPFNIIIAAHSIGNNVQINPNVTIDGNCGKLASYVDKWGSSILCL